MPTPKSKFSSLSRWLSRTPVKGMPPSPIEGSTNIIHYVLSILGLEPNREAAPTYPPTPAPEVQAYINSNGRLNDAQIPQYRAAGALVIARNKKEEPVVLFVQERSKPSGSPPVATLPGGKIDKVKDNKNPLATCRREVWEETCGLLDLSFPQIFHRHPSQSREPNAEDVSSIERLGNAAERSPGGCLWVPSSKYALFVVEAAQVSGVSSELAKEKEDWFELPNVFENSLSHLDDAWRREHSMEKTLSLHWVSLDTLISHVAPIEIPETVIDDGEEQEEGIKSKPVVNVDDSKLLERDDAFKPREETPKKGDKHILIKQGDKTNRNEEFESSEQDITRSDERKLVEPSNKSNPSKQEVEGKPIERPALLDICGNPLILHRFAIHLLRSKPGRELLGRVAADSSEIALSSETTSIKTNGTNSNVSDTTATTSRTNSYNRE